VEATVAATVAAAARMVLESAADTARIWIESETARRRRRASVMLRIVTRRESIPSELAIWDVRLVLMASVMVAADNDADPSDTAIVTLYPVETVKALPDTTSLSAESWHAMNLTLEAEAV